jgi:hypothetical protein
LENGKEYFGNSANVLDFGLNGEQLILNLVGVKSFNLESDLELFDFNYQTSKNENPFLECVETFSETT